MLGKLPLPRFQQPGPGPPLELEQGAVREPDQQQAVLLQLAVAQRQRAPRLEQRRERVEEEDDVLPFMLVTVDCARNSRESRPSSRSTVKMTTFQAERQNIYPKTAKH